MDTSLEELLLKNLKSIPDFPVKGVLFRDVTTLYGNPECLRAMVAAIAAIYRDCGITKVLGIESRGFIAGAAIACELGAGFVPVRKPGKLPRDVYFATYQKEYGPDTIEIHKDALTSDDVVLIHDDLLATGGTSAATVELMTHFGIEKIYANYIIELTSEFPEARSRVGVPVTSLLKL